MEIINVVKKKTYRPQCGFMLYLENEAGFLGQLKHLCGISIKGPLSAILASIWVSKSSPFEEGGGGLYILLQKYGKTIKSTFMIKIVHSVYLQYLFL